MFENPRRGRQARNFTTNVPKILGLKSSSEQIFSENCRWVSLKFSRRSWRVLLWGFSAGNDNEIQTNCRVEFDVKKNQNNKILVGSYLRCAYNHVLLQKNFTVLSNSLLNTSKIEDLFRTCALSSPVTFLTGNNRIWPDLAFGFVRKRSGSLGSISNKKKVTG